MLDTQDAEGQVPGGGGGTRCSRPGEPGEVQTGEQVGANSGWRQQSSGQLLSGRQRAPNPSWASPWAPFCQALGRTEGALAAMGTAQAKARKREERGQRACLSAAGRAVIIWKGQDSETARSQMAIFSQQTDRHLHAPSVTQLQDTRNPQDNRMGQHSNPSCLTDRISSPPLPGRSMAGAFHYSGRGCAA